jgi:hypothetical protein
MAVGVIVSRRIPKESRIPTMAAFATRTAPNIGRSPKREDRVSDVAGP